MADPAILLTEEEVAALLKCSRKTVQRRPIPYHKNGRKSRLYKQEDVEAYLCQIRVVKQQDEQPSHQSSEPKEERPSGLRVVKYRRGNPTVQLAQDELSGALARALRRKSSAKRNARSGTRNTKSDSETRAA